MVARYFDSIWPEYERKVVVDGSGVVTGETIQRRRPCSYFTVINHSKKRFLNKYFFLFNRFFHLLCAQLLF